MKRSITLAMMLATVALPAFAKDAALVIGNENYRNANDISGADDALDAADALGAGGFMVHKGADLDQQAMRDLVASFYGDTETPGRSVILLAGHFVHAGADTWLVSTDADDPSLATIDSVGLPLATVLAMAAERPGGALVLLGTEDRGIDLGRGLSAGIGPVEVPQGVTLITGDAGDLAEFASDLPARRGQSMAALVADARGFQARGYLGDVAAFLPDQVTGQAPQPAPAAAAAADDGEAAFWIASQSIGSRSAYEAYLDRFPDGAHVAAARSALAQFDDPMVQAKAAEEALNLSSSDRQEIQRDLSILDINPKGIDGVFGPGSRAAIATWQGRKGEDATGYLTAPQISLLADEADKRAAVLEAEAAARKAEQDRQDRLYWDGTGAKGGEPGLRAYLDRYPDGIFAELAQERLDIIEGNRRQAAAQADRTAWDKALTQDTVKAYRAYLSAFPKGAFVAEAKQKVAALSETPQQTAIRQQAMAEEKALNLGSGIRLLIEKRLDKLELKPGPVDGKFDQATRRAIRRYQQSLGVPVTGYLNQQVVARILVGSL